MKRIHKRYLTFFIYLLPTLVVFAQEDERPSYEFSLLRQDDNVEEWGEAEKKSRYDGFKWIKLGPDQVLSFGGSYRGQYERFSNEEFSFSPNRENGWYLQRILLHSDLRFGSKFRVFGELGSSLIEGKEDLAPVDRDRLYMNQLFAEFKVENLTITAGRENLKLGSRRLLDPREGPNVRRAFDHLSAEWVNGERNFLLFGGSPVVPREGVFDNLGFQNKEWLWGAYVGKLLTGDVHLDAYYLGSNYSESTYGLGTGDERRHSIGVRTWKSTREWRYDNEAVFQFGSFGERDILAWTISFNIKNQLNEKHQLGVKTELISGSTSENRLGTFNPLYPRGAYFGRVARFGPANLIDVHPYWTFRTGKFTMELDYDVFWRFSKDDVIYGPPMNIVLEGTSDQRFIAQQIGGIFNYEFSPFAVVEVETNFIFPGSYIETIRPGSRTLLHMVITAEVRF
ncbi:MAG: alginate export family protein [Bacteroidota bacterium]